MVPGMPTFGLIHTAFIRRSSARIGCHVMMLTFLLQACWVQGQDPEVRAFRSADLPQLMRFLDGSAVETKEDWQRRRDEIAGLWCDTYFGHFPEEVPEILEAKLQSETQREDGVTVRNVRLVFDTPQQTACDVRILLPRVSLHHQEQTLPLLLTQPRNYQLAWGEAAVRRGYIVCYYPGVDYNHREQDFPGFESTWKKFKEAYPKATWSSSLAIQSWIAGRVLDYLLSERSWKSCFSKTARKTFAGSDLASSVQLFARVQRRLWRAGNHGLLSTGPGRLCGVEF